jgi:hypothetical protein
MQASMMHRTRARSGPMTLRPQHAAAFVAAGVLLLALLSAPGVSAADSGAPDTMDIGSWALDAKAFGAPHKRAEYELPRGVKRGTPEADAYFRKWLQCSTLVTWCTVEEVACGCVGAQRRRPASQCACVHATRARAVSGRGSANSSSSGRMQQRTGPHLTCRMPAQVHIRADWNLVSRHVRLVRGAQHCRRIPLAHRRTLSRHR